MRRFCGVRPGVDAHLAEVGAETQREKVTRRPIEGAARRAKEFGHNWWRDGAGPGGAARGLHSEFAWHLHDRVRHAISFLLVRITWWTNGEFSLDKALHRLVANSPLELKNRMNRATVRENGLWLCDRGCRSRFRHFRSDRG